MVVIDAIPVPWRQSLKMNGYVNKRPFVLHDQIQLLINNQNVLFDKAQSKSIYRELISGLVTPPTAQLRYNESFDNVCLVWEQIANRTEQVAQFISYLVLTTCSDFQNVSSAAAVF